MKVINALPSYDSPNMFTLPANIDRVVQRAQSTAVISQLKQLVYWDSMYDLLIDIVDNTLCCYITVCERGMGESVTPCYQSVEAGMCDT